MSHRLPSGRPPTENTLTVNITSEILDDVQEVFEEAVVTSPTRRRENHYGYDTAMDWGWAKAFALQYKRPSEDTGGIQGGPSGQYIKFSANDEQIRKLRGAYRPEEAFLVLPTVQRRSSMPDNLKRDTVFIDVHGITVKEPTLIYIPPNHGPDTSLPIYIRGDSGVTDIDSDDIYYWDELWEGLLECTIGHELDLRSSNYEIYDDFRSRTTRVVTFGGESPPNQ